MLNERAVEKAFKGIKADMSEILLRLAKLEKKETKKRSNLLVTSGYGVKTKLILRFFKENKGVVFTASELAKKFDMEYIKTYQRLIYLARKKFLVKENVNNKAYFKYNTQVR